MQLFTLLEQYEAAEPFQSFEIMLSDGTAILVDHPELLDVRRTEREIRITVGDSLYVVSGLHVVGLHFKTPADRANG